MCVGIPTPVGAGRNDNRRWNEALVLWTGFQCRHVTNIPQCKSCPIRSLVKRKAQERTPVPGSARPIILSQAGAAYLQQGIYF